MGKQFKPNFLDFTIAEEGVLRSKLGAIRAAISHPGEKGESTELEIMQLLRGFLPAEYGLGTGFIVYHPNECIEKAQIVEDGNFSYKCSYNPTKDILKLSTQIDIIIYDALRSGPIVKLGTCEVFPLEGVYGYVEVKTSVGKRKDKDGKTAIQKLYSQSNDLRSMKSKLYWSSIPGTYTKAQVFPFPVRESISIRSYVVILDAEALGSRNEIHKTLQDDYRNDTGEETFLHGIYMNGKAFYRFSPSESPLTPDQRSIVMVDKGPLSEFKKALYIDLSRYPRTPEKCTIAIDKYFNQTNEGVVSSTLHEKNGKKEILIG
jgi:hypothetical protein